MHCVWRGMSILCCSLLRQNSLKFQHPSEIHGDSVRHGMRHVASRPADSSPRFRKHDVAHGRHFWQPSWKLEDSMSLISTDNGKTIYRCARCPVTFQHGQHYYGGGRYVGEKLYCKNCADDIAPQTVSISIEELKRYVNGQQA